jgi:hypothetical protein
MVMSQARSGEKRQSTMQGPQLTLGSIRITNKPMIEMHFPKLRQRKRPWQGA